MTQTTILLIDQASNRRIMLNVMLSAAGYRVVQVTTLGEVPQLLRRINIDLAVCALGLPDGRAEDLPAMLRREQPNVESPVLGIAAQNDVSGRLRALGAGLDEVLMAPIEDRMLLARIQSLLKPAPFATAKAVLQHGGFAEDAHKFIPAEPMSRLVISGSRAVDVQLCYEALQNHADLHLIPVIRSANAESLPDADCLLFQVSSTTDLYNLKSLIASCHHVRPSILALVNSEHYVAALEAGADDAIIAPISARELLIRVRSQLRRRARAERRRSLRARGAAGTIEAPRFRQSA